MKTSLNVINHLSVQLSEMAQKISDNKPSLIGIMAGSVRSLQSDTELLKNAWSDMAIRNILSGILRSVQQIQNSVLTIAKAPVIAQPKANAGSDKAPASRGQQPLNTASGDNPFLVSTCKGVCDDLIRRINVELKRHSPGLPRRYNQAVCVGYKIKVVNDAGYWGHYDDLQDMKDHCADLKKAIQEAKKLINDNGRNYNANEKILKVFAAPEFFFRGRNGAYDYDVVHGVEKQTDKSGVLVTQKQQGIAEIMLEEIGKPEYKDWLFVLGTAVAAAKITEIICMQTGCTGKVVFDLDRPTNKTKPRCSKDASHPTGEKIIGAQVENVGLIIKEKEVHKVTKELVSDIDYIALNANPAVNQPAIVNEVKLRGEALKVNRFGQKSQYDTASPISGKFKDERMGGCIFTIDGITIGVEVCLDHDATVDSDSSGRLSNAGNIQLQIIPSAGMCISALRTVQGGIVFNVDGHTPHVRAIAGTKPRWEYGAGTNVTWAFTAGNWNDMANIVAMKDFNDKIKEANDLQGKGSGNWEQATVAISAASGRGEVVIYGPYDIPGV
jgi:hypothetical protein